jgi:hypothetical protein
MAITLNLDEKKELDERTRKDPRVIMRFFEALGAYQKVLQNDALACRLAFREQTQLYDRVYLEKMEEYLTEVQGDYRKRLEIRKKWGTGLRFKTKSGIRVRSKAEKIIADFLFDNRITFVYEPILSLGRFYVVPDFLLTDHNLCIEHFGLESRQYQESAQSKLERFRQFKIPVICTYAAEEPDIEEVLTKKLTVAGVTI